MTGCGALRNRRGAAQFPESKDKLPLRVDSDTDEDDPMRSFPPALAKLQN